MTLTAYSGLGGELDGAGLGHDQGGGHNALPAVAMMVVDEDGEELDPQPTSVAEGTSVMVAVMPVDEDGDAINAEEELTVALTPTGTADAADYTLVGTFTIKMGDGYKQCRRNRGAVGRGCRHGIAHVRRRGDPVIATTAQGPSRARACCRSTLRTRRRRRLRRRRVRPTTRRSWPRLRRGAATTA